MKSLKGITANITGSGCMNCWCTNGWRPTRWQQSPPSPYGFVNVKNAPDNDPCVEKWIEALNAIKSANNGLAGDVAALYRDPWGSPYHLDENEGEYNCPVSDYILSVGPNGMRDADMPTSDDISLTISRLSCDK